MIIGYFTVNCLSYKKILKKSRLTEFYEKLKSLKDGDHRKLYQLDFYTAPNCCILPSCYNHYHFRSKKT